MNTQERTCAINRLTAILRDRAAATAHAPRGKLAIFAGHLTETEIRELLEQEIPAES